MTTSDLYRSQFENSELTSTANLIAVDLLGHGRTRSTSEQFTYWDSAIMILQVLDNLNVKDFFALGTSQGGWIVTRLALLAPTRIRGIIALGTSMDTESERTQRLGCWTVGPIADALVGGWTSETPTPDFVLDDGYLGMLVDLGLGKDCDAALRDFWVSETRERYRGDDGRLRARMASINLRDRDGLHGRLWDIRAPVLWMHGTADTVYSVANAEEEIKLFTRSKDAQLKVVEGGQHFLSASKPEVVDKAVVEFVRKYAKD